MPNASLSNHPQPSIAVNGFSLMELLVVLVLLGFMAGITGPSIGRFLDGLKTKKQISTIMADFRFGRLKSITSGKMINLTLADDGETLQYTGGISESRVLSFGEDDSLEMNPREITFYPEGQATPGTIVYSMGEKKRIITIDPLTGMAILD